MIQDDVLAGVSLLVFKLSMFLAGNTTRCFKISALSWQLGMAFAVLMLKVKLILEAKEKYLIEVLRFVLTMDWIQFIR